MLKPKFFLKTKVRQILLQNELVNIDNDKKLETIDLVTIFV